MPNSAPVTFSLYQDEAHVWFAWTSEFTDNPVLDACRELLSREESERQERFHFEQDRHTYLVSHAMVRLVLAGYLGARPDELKFTTNPYGRPELVHDSGQLDIRFNLSHTRDLAALVVTHTHPCGIDVETNRYHWDLSSLATSVLSAEEMKTFQGLPEEERSQAFLRHWTLKEAYVKARGIGLSLPLDHLTFDIDDTTGVRLGTRHGIDSIGWQFAQGFPGPAHVMAVALHHGADPRLSVTYREFSPSIISYPDRAWPNRTTTASPESTRIQDFGNSSDGREKPVSLKSYKP